MLPVETSVFNALESVFPTNLSEFDAYVITGSKYSAYEDLPWIRNLKHVVSQIHSTTTSKILGICFGHQILAEALGGKVSKNPKGWEVGHTTIQLNALGASVLHLSQSTLVHSKILIPLEYSIYASRSCLGASAWI